MSVDISFIIPPFTYKGMKSSGAITPHLGVASIAAYIREKGYEVNIVDAYAKKLSYDEILKKVRGYNPKLVGITAVTVEFPFAIELSKRIKEEFEIPIILGGPHVGTFPNTLKDHPYFDCGVIGEGEITTLNLCDHYIKDSANGLKKIKGIVFQENGQAVFTKPQPMIDNIDTLPFPAYDLLPMDLYRPYAVYDVGRKFTTVVTTRGCPFKCIYCNSSTVFGNKWRWMSSKRTFELLKYLHDEFHISHFYIQDDEYTVNNKRCEEIAKMIIDNKMDIIYECLSRATDYKSLEFPKLLHKSGLVGVAFGVESGSDETLKKIKKGCTKEDIRRSFRLCDMAGIERRASFIMGFPWETKQHIKETIAFAKELDPDIVYFQILTPYPNTEVYKEIVDEKLLNMNVNDYANWIQHNIVGTEPMVHTRYLTSEELKKLNARAFLEFYTNHRFIKRKLRTLTKNPQMIKRYLMTGYELIRNSALRYLMPSRF